MAEHEAEPTGAFAVINQKLAEIRKCIAAGITAGFGAAITAGIAALQSKSDGGVSITSAEWETITLAGVTVAVSAGYAAWQTFNRKPKQEQTTAGYPAGAKFEPDDALVTGSGTVDE